uniref:Uncharacterized protein n=1 Tax=Rhizophora mucronata TaxID=61149 RepID=A0A2P2NI24_RHIMU
MCAHESKSLLDRPADKQLYRCEVYFADIKRIQRA